MRKLALILTLFVGVFAPPIWLVLLAFDGSGAVTSELRTPRELQRRSVVALSFGAVLFTLLVGCMGIMGNSEPMSSIPWSGIMFSGWILLGPFAYWVTVENGLAIYAVSTWLALVAWIILIRCSRIGDLHWAWHIGSLAIWIVMGMISWMYAVIRDF